MSEAQAIISDIRDELALDALIRQYEAGEPLSMEQIAQLLMAYANLRDALRAIEGILQEAHHHQVAPALVEPAHVDALAAVRRVTAHRRPRTAAHDRGRS